MPIGEAITAYAYVAKSVFSDVKFGGDGKFKSTKLEVFMKNLVEKYLEDAHMLDIRTGACKTFVQYFIIEFTHTTQGLSVPCRRSI
jgi:hypothetical protein